MATVERKSPILDILGDLETHFQADSSRRLTSSLDLLFNYCALIPVGVAS